MSKNSKYQNRLKRLWLAALMGGSLATLSCGYYTNVPAQIKQVSTGEGLSASVNYTVSAAQVAATVKNPKLVLEGEAGSIGVTYDTMKIEYQPPNLPLNPISITIATSMRVASSHQLDKDNKVTQGRGEVELPVISSRIVELGNPLAQSRINTQISAKVTLSGVDDAGFNSSIDVYVPINFLSAALPR